MIKFPQFITVRILLYDVMRIFMVLSYNPKAVKEECIEMFKYLPNQVQNEFENKIEKYLDSIVIHNKNSRRRLSRLLTHPRFTRIEMESVVNRAQIEFDIKNGTDTNKPVKAGAQNDKTLQE